MAGTFFDEDLGEGLRQRFKRDAAGVREKLRFIPISYGTALGHE